jgi:hypothetical protein
MYPFQREHGPNQGRRAGQIIRDATSDFAGAWKTFNVCAIARGGARISFGRRGVETPNREPAERQRSQDLFCDRVADAYVQAIRLKAFAPVSFQVSNIRFRAGIPVLSRMPPAVWKTPSRSHGGVG